MEWSLLMDLDDLQMDVYQNGWSEDYRNRLRQLCPDCGLTKDDPDSDYQKILDSRLAN